MCVKIIRFQVKACIWFEIKIKEGPICLIHWIKTHSNAKSIKTKK